MSNIDMLFENKWVSILERTLDNGSKYVYSHEPWSGSLGVAVLPYRYVENVEFSFTHIEFLARYEICPAHSEEVERCSITGGHDVKHESFHETAKRELLEEAGYDVPVSALQQLGMVKPSKASDKTMHLFAVDVTDYQRGVAHGDGTLGEEGAYCDWTTRQQALFSKDPLLSTMVARHNYLP